MIKLLASWPHLENTGMYTKDSIQKRSTQKWAMDLGILPFTRGTHVLLPYPPPTTPQYFITVFRRRIPFYVLLQPLQQPAPCFARWWYNCYTEMPSASFFSNQLLTRLLQNTGLERWEAHPKWVCQQQTWCASHITSKMPHEELPKRRQTNIECVEPYFCAFWVILFKENWSRRLKSRK